MNFCVAVGDGLDLLVPELVVNLEGLFDDQVGVVALQTMEDHGEELVHQCCICHEPAHDSILFCDRDLSPLCRSL